MQTTALSYSLGIRCICLRTPLPAGAAFFLSVVKAVVRGSTSEMKTRKKLYKITISVKIMRFQPKLWLNVAKMLFRKAVRRNGFQKQNAALRTLCLNSEV